MSTKMISHLLTQRVIDVAAVRTTFKPLAIKMFAAFNLSLAGDRCSACCFAIRQRFWRDVLAKATYRAVVRAVSVLLIQETPYLCHDDDSRSGAACHSNQTVRLVCRSRRRKLSATWALEVYHAA